MSTKYCDHGVYGSATVDAAHWSCTTSVLTVTAGATITGSLSVGSEISGGGLADGYFIVSLGNGTGGEGTYNLALYNTYERPSPGALASPNGPLVAIAGQPLNIPIYWGEAQEGDGSGRDKAVSSTVAVDLASATAASGATISILGATLTCGSTATNYFAAGSGATLVANIVAAINARGTNAVAAWGTGWLSPQLRDAVYARVGSTSTTLEIMTRAGSTAYNAASVTTAGFTGGTFGPYAFSGGVSGCWGRTITNSNSSWPSLSYGRYGYGIFTSNPSIAGSISAGDNIRIRAGKTILFYAGGNVFLPSMGTESLPVTFDIDDGTVWPEDGATPVFKFVGNNTSSNPFSFGSASNGAFIHFRGATYPGGKNFKVQTNGNAGNQSPGIQMFGPILYEDLEFEAIVDGGTPYFTHSNQFSPAIRGASALNCLVKWKNTTQNMWYLAPASNRGTMKFIGSKFVASAQTTVNPGIVVLSDTAGTKLILEGCKFSGLVPNSRLFRIGQSFSSYDTGLTAVNTDFGTSVILGPSTLNSAVEELEAGSKGVFTSSQYGTRDFTFERAGRCFVEWQFAKGRPTLNALLPDGLTRWSIFAVSSNLISQSARTVPIDLPRISKLLPANADLPSGIRVFTVNFLTDSTLSSWTKADFSALLTYQDTAGNVVSLSSYDSAAAPLDTSSASWSSVSWNGQTWLKRAFTFLTTQPVAANTEVTVVPRFHTTCPSEANGIILCPEILVA
jgi:hypothetical protein